jgi:hypothetical protein
MTKLLKKAFEEASKLPELEQNVLAKQLLNDLVAEKKWEKAFANSEDILSRLADEAIEEHKQGRTKPLDIDSL